MENLVPESLENPDKNKLENEAVNEKPLFIEQQELYEKYKETLTEITEKAVNQAVDYERGEDVLYIDTKKLSLLRNILKDKGEDITSTEALQDRLPHPNVADSYNRDQQESYINNSIDLYNSKELLLHQAVISESTKERLTQELVEGANRGNFALNRMEVLAYLGVTPQTFEKIKESIVESGNMVVIEKLCQNFSVSLTEQELQLIAENAYEKDSLYDLEKIIEKIPDLDKKFIEKRNQLIENAKEAFVLNKKRIIDGIENKDLLVHFSKRKNLESIMENGILSILDQKEVFGRIEMGEGPDLQEIFGRQDCVSVFNFYKGAEGDADHELYKKLKDKVLDLMYDFQENYPERVFLVGGYTTLGADTIHVKEEDKEKYLNKFTKNIYMSSDFKQYIDPNEKNNPSSLNVLSCHDDGEWSVSKQKYGDPIFTELFFENIDDKKQMLLDGIKKLMKDAYETSVNKKNSSKVESGYRAGTAFDVDSRGNSKNDKVTFILDPSLSKTFTMSSYFSESFVDEKITPDKILGIKIIDGNIERECYNSGKVGFSAIENSTPEELEKIKSNIIFNDTGIVVYADNPYENK